MALEPIMSTMKYFSSLLLYLAIFEYYMSSLNTPDSKFSLLDLKLLYSTNEITLDLNSQYEHTAIFNKFLVAAIECLDGVLIELGDKQNNSELRYAGVGEWVQVK
ncbi:unnamed protein product [Rotaria sp. Silwood2]|nr:unnamed protein product [Rotaria sp. Silwood2]CAF4437559.1 unnamed protein product [Rotaria sp. Silwood2]